MTHYMNTEINDKLDVLIALSAKDCGNDDVEMFRSLDKSDVNLGKNFYAKQRRIVNKYERKPTVTLLRKCLIRVAVALMALMSVGFLTVMAVPDLREAVFEAVVEWYENYVSIRFEPSGGENNEHTDTKSSTTSASSEITGESDIANTVITPPTKIEKVMKPTYIPEGAEEDIVMNSMISVIIDYYLGDDVVLSYTQTTYNNRDKLYDNKTSISREIDVNGHSAVILEFESDGQAIIWTDGVYYFEIVSSVFDINELIKAASSVH